MAAICCLSFWYDWLHSNIRSKIEEVYLRKHLSCSGARGLLSPLQLGIFKTYSRSDTDELAFSMHHIVDDKYCFA